MKRIAILSLIVALLLPSVAYAQDGNRALPPCTKTQIYEVFDIAQPAVEKIAYFNDELLAVSTQGEMSALIREANAAQVTWWGYNAQKLPNCRLSWVAMILIGRTYDEFLLTLLLLDGHYETLVEDHSNAMTTIGEDLDTLYTIMQEDLPY